MTGPLIRLKMIGIQTTHGVENGNDGNTDIGKHRRPHTDNAERTEKQDDTFDTKHKENILRIKNGTELHFSYLWNPKEEMKRIQSNGNVDDETVKERFLMN